MVEKPDASETAAESGDRAEAQIPKGKAAKGKKPAKRKKRAKRNVGGRPQWQPSIENRQLVEQMKFCGESEAMIARALKVDVATLRKHCGYELENGYANRRAEVTKALFEAAGKGNVSAIKRLDDMGKLSKAASAVANRGKPEEVVPKTPAKIGKKEQQQQAAAQVTGKFAPPPPPKLVVNNGG